MPDSVGGTLHPGPTFSLHDMHGVHYLALASLQQLLRLYKQAQNVSVVISLFGLLYICDGIEEGPSYSVYLPEHRVVL